MKFFLKMEKAKVLQMNLWKRIRSVAGVFGLLVSVAGLASCGGAGVVDPLSLFSSSTPPQLEPIVSGISGGGVFAGNSGFTSSTPYWVLNAVGGFGGLSYIAPADGIVISQGPLSVGGISGFSLTIMHAGRLATRYIGITPIVRTGDSVVRGQTIGALTAITGLNAIGFQVLLDGAPVCPLTFLSANFRNQVNNFYGFAGFLCQ